MLMLLTLLLGKTYIYTVSQKKVSQSFFKYLLYNSAKFRKFGVQCLKFATIMYVFCISPVYCLYITCKK